MRTKFPEGTTLRQMVGTLLSTYSGDTDARVLTDQDIDHGGVSNIAREIHESAISGSGISFSEAEPYYSASGYDEGMTSVMVFRLGEEYVVAVVAYPNYCDDNYDGSLNSMTGVLTLDEAKAKIEEIYAEARQALEDHINKMGETKGFLFDKMDREHGQAPEVDEDEQVLA